MILDACKGCGKELGQYRVRDNYAIDEYCDFVCAKVVGKKHNRIKPVLRSEQSLIKVSYEKPATILHCPNCNTKHELPEFRSGDDVDCCHCGSLFRVVLSHDRPS